MWSPYRTQYAQRHGFGFHSVGVVSGEEGSRRENGCFQGALLKKEQKAFILTILSGSGVMNDNGMSRSKCLENFGHDPLSYEIQIK